MAIPLHAIKLLLSRIRTISGTCHFCDVSCRHEYAHVLQVEGDLSTWYREIDFEPPGKPDVGRMTFVTPNILHEDDPDAASAAYHETWERVPGTSDASQCWGFR